MYFDDGDATFTETLTFTFTVDNPGVATGALIGNNMLRVYGDAKGTATVTVTATDQDDQSVSDSFMVEVERNDPPIANHDFIDDVSTRIGLVEDPIDATGAFTDEGDTLTYSVTTSDPDVATTAIKYDDEGGPWIVLHSHSPGTTKCTLTATDSGKNTAEVSFSIEVGARNDAPTVANAIDDVTIVVDERHDVELADVFDDEGDLDIEVVNEDETVADVVHRRSANEIRIYGNAVGTTTVTVTATDNVGQSVSDQFDVNVEAAPQAVGTIADVTLQIGGEDFDLDVSEYFSHADGVDVLTYSVSTNGSAATVAIVGQDLALSPYTRGSTEISVIATGPKGHTATQSFTTIVSDSELRKVAENALAGYARAVVSGTANVVGSRLESSRSDTGVSLGKFLPVSNGESSYLADSAISANSALVGFNYEAAQPTGRDMTLNVNSFVNHNFSKVLNGKGGMGSWSLWSTTDTRNFAGEGYSGNTKSTFMGIDLLADQNWLVGVTASRNTGESDYSWGTASQSMDIEMLSVMPYFNYEPNSKTSVWGVVGLGSGDVTSTVVNASSQSSDLAMGLGILGGRLEVARAGGMQFAVRGDVAVASLATDAGDGAVDDLSTEVHRIRAGLESSTSINLRNGNIRPFGEVAFRNDGGDGLTGSGVEVAGGIEVQMNSFTIEARGHMTTSHSAEDFSESGFSLKTELTPSSDGTGLSLALTPRWMSSTGTRSHSSIWSNSSNGTTGGLQSIPDGNMFFSNQKGMTVDATIGYGLRLNSDRLFVKPFVEIQSSDAYSTATLMGFDLKQLMKSSRTIDLRFVAGRISNDYVSNNQFGMNATVRF